MNKRFSACSDGEDIGVANNLYWEQKVNLTVGFDMNYSTSTDTKKRVGCDYMWLLALKKTLFRVRMRKY